MAVHRLLWSLVDDCASAVILFLKTFYFYWPIFIHRPPYLVLVLPHAWEIFLKMLAINSHREFHTIQLLKHVSIAL